jgi:hypothetical protein
MVRLFVLSARSPPEIVKPPVALATVIFAEPLNETPPMVRAVWSVLVVFALPEISIPAVPAEIFAAVMFVRFAAEIAPNDPDHVPLVIVPTVTISVLMSLDEAMAPASIVFVTFPAPIAVVIVPVPLPDMSPESVIV